MSKRYGRNQKRSHREEIEKLKLAYKVASERARRTSADIAEAQSKISGIMRIIEDICPYSIALPAKKVAGSGPRGEYRVVYQPRLNIRSTTLNNTLPSMTSFKQINLGALRVYAETNRETLQTAIHLKYEAGGHSAYMIPRATFRLMPEDVLLREVVPMVARALVSHIRDGK